MIPEWSQRMKLTRTAGKVYYKISQIHEPARQYVKPLILNSLLPLLPRRLVNFKEIGTLWKSILFQRDFVVFWYMTLCVLLKWIPDRLMARQVKTTYSTRHSKGDGGAHARIWMRKSTKSPPLGADHVAYFEPCHNMSLINLVTPYGDINLDQHWLR